MCTVLYDSSKEDFILSGIGQEFGTKLTVPKDATKALVRKPPKDRKDSTWSYKNWKSDWWCDSPFFFKRQDWRYLPLFIHMSCWKLAQWKLGPSVTENLELFTAIALQTTFDIVIHSGDSSWPSYVREIITMGMPPVGKS